MFNDGLSGRRRTIRWLHQNLTEVLAMLRPPDVLAYGRTLQAGGGDGVGELAGEGVFA